MLLKWLNLKRGKLNVETLYRAEILYLAILLSVVIVRQFWRLVNVPILGDGFLQSRGVSLAVIEFELAFVIWVFCDPFPKWTRRLTLGLFLFFTCASIYLRLNSETLCGLSHTFSINPWFSTMFDMITLGILCLLEYYQNAAPPEETPSLSKKRLTWAIVVWLIVAPSLTEFMLKYPEMNDTYDLGTYYTGYNGKETVLIEPEKWNDGEYCPLLQVLDPFVQEHVKSGEWTVVLYRDKVKDLRAIADLKAKDLSQVLCVEIPLFPNFPEKLMAPFDFPTARLDQKKDWVVETPLIFKIKDQILVDKDDDERDDSSEEEEN